MSPGITPVFSLLRTHAPDLNVSRFRRVEIGQHHHFGLTYLSNYANEVAYREDTRREPNGTIFRDILTKCAHTRPQWPWCGYWQKSDVQRAERLAA